MRPVTRATAILPILIVVLAACGEAAGGTPIASPSPTPTPFEDESPTPSASPSETPMESPSEESPAPSEPAATPSPTIAVDSVVQTTVAGLRLRENPGTGAPSTGTLSLGAPSYVVDGPVVADGYSWYLVSGLGLPQASGCAGPQQTDPWTCPVWFGWVAAASTDGDPWLETREVDCPSWPEAVTNEITYGVQRIAYLACYGDDERTLTGFYPLIPDDAGLGGACGNVPAEMSWIACNLGYEHIGTEDTSPFGDGLVFSVDPSTVTMPERGQWIRITGRFDHAAADACTFEDPPVRSVLQCRAQFVVESAEAVPAP